MNFRRALGGGLFAFLAACGAADPDVSERKAQTRWIALAEAYAPPQELARADGTGATLEAWIAAPAEVWTQRGAGAAADGDAPSVWFTPHPEGGLPPVPGSELGLEMAGESTAFERIVRPTSNMEGLDTATATEIELSAARPTAPVGARFRVQLNAGSRQSGRWRIVYGNRVADGFALVAGVPQRIPLEAPAGARLALEAAFKGFGGTAVAARLRVFANERELQTVALGSVAERFEWELDEAVSELRFELDGTEPADGAGGVGVLLAPGVAFEQPASSEERPGDLVLVIADTFRADLLDAQREGAPLLPNLHALMSEGMRYSRTWAPAPWTLPSTASLLFGRYPYDHVAVDYDRRPREDLLSLADRLRAEGYRTAAVTEGVFVSRLYGMDRGFESFEECAPGDLESTLRLARERLAVDDGRPLFLLVHTYRTHAPYHVSEHVLEHDGPGLGATRTWDQLIGKLSESVAKHLELAPGQAQAGNEWDVLLQFIDEDGWLETIEGLDGSPEEPGEGDSPQGVLATLRGLYEATALELDRELGGFLEELYGRPRPPLIAFTSDHGEAFGEHDRIFHGLGLWEELLRVPFVVHGPGVSSGVDPTPASLVDLPSTVCGWLGIAPDPNWAGRNLSRESAEATLYAFDTERQAQPRIAIVDFPHKVGVAADSAAIAAGERLFGYDLSTDPGERHNLLNDPAIAGVDLLPVLQMLGISASSGPRVQVDEEQRRLLEALGYR